MAAARLVGVGTVVQEQIIGVHDCVRTVLNRRVGEPILVSQLLTTSTIFVAAFS